MSSSPSHQTVLVYVTCPSQDVAEEIATALVEARHAACANILPQMTSIYRWQGKMMRDEEVVLILKTARKLADIAVKAVVSRHPYDVPAVLVLSVDAGHEGFLSWIDDETSPAE